MCRCLLDDNIDEIDEYEIKGGGGTDFDVYLITSKKKVLILKDL